MLKKISIGGSKSITNRLLILNSLYDNCIELSNLSQAQDTDLLQKALQSKSSTLDIHHAGTAMRFLTSFLSIQEGKETVLTGSERMKQRPIAELVNALKQIEASVEYIEKEGFPPLKIQGKKLVGGEITIDGSISSQYITSLLLIGSKLPKGLTLKIEGKWVSLPYVMMTINIQNQLGIETKIEDSVISVPFTPTIKPQAFFIESDWSSASYYFSKVAINRTEKIFLTDLQINSVQADAKIVAIYESYFGVKTTFNTQGIELEAIPDFRVPERIEINCNTFPDIAQTIIVTAFALQIKCTLTGLETLKIKETDRIFALKTELEKFGGICETSDDSIELKAFQKPHSNIELKTYKDHRMAMAFAPLFTQYSFEIEDKDVG